MQPSITNRGGDGNPLNNQKGFALLLSLLVLLLLVVIVLEVDFQTRADLRAAGNFRDDLKAFYLARSAITAGEAILKEDLRLSPKYDGLDELWAFPVPEYPLGDGTLSGSITDESGKININSLIGTGDKAVEARREQLRRLFELLQLNPDSVDPIIDWLDKNSEPLPFGAEEGFYRGMTPPYSPKNGPLDTLEELHMIKGITDEVYKKIAPYLTIYGDGKLNINTADKLVLQTLAEGVDETMVRKAIEGRPYENTTRTKFMESFGADFKNKLKLDIATTSSFYSILAEGKVQDTRKIVRAVVKRGSPSQLLYFKVE
jgi:general secretion pathway protein K